MKRISFVLFVIWLAGINQLVAQVPVISSFSPASGPIGIEVTIQGSNFDSTPINNTVYFGGVKATVLTANTSELVVEVPTSAGNQSISVLVNGLTAYSTDAFKVTFEGEGAITSGSFDSGVSLTPGDDPVVAVHADFDGDGLLDLASANDDGQSYSVFRNTSTGPGNIGFGSDEGAGLGINPKDIAYADFDGDGLLDLAIGNSDASGTTNNIRILRNTSTVGSITFNPQLSFPADSAPLSIAVGDMNGDGKADIVAVDGANSEVSIFENTTTSGIGVVTFAAHVDFTVGANPVSVAIADVDGDDLLDIITANGDDRSVSILRNTTVGGILSFEAKVDFPVNASTPTYVLRVGDLDNDGLPDLITKNSRHLSILRNTSTTSNVSMATAQDILFDTGNTFPGLGDLNGDGKLDVVLNDNGDYEIEILNNTSVAGAISFASSVKVRMGATIDYTMSYTTVNDLDGDGEPEIIAPGQIGSFFGSPTPVIYLMRNLGSGTDILSFSLTDQTKPATIDYDAHTIDVEVSNIPNLTNLVATFSTSFRALPNVDGINPDSGITALDYTNPVTFTVYAEDGSGIQDWIVTVTLVCIEDVVNETVEACGSYEFDGQVLTNSGTYTSTFLNTVDCDSTVTLNLTINPTHFYEDVYTTGSYVFDGATLSTSGQYEYGPFVSSTGCDSTYVLNLTIEPDTYDLQDFLQFQQLEVPFVGVLGANYLGDLDGDGDQDAMILGNIKDLGGGRETAIYMNQGNGTFLEDESHVLPDVFTWHNSCKLFDIDGDGDLDFILYGQTQASPSPINVAKLYLNDGSGNFVEKTDAGLPLLESNAIDGADVDGDGDIDLIISGTPESGPVADETKLWLNDGNEVFNEATDVDFLSADRGTVDFGDVDQDGDQDVFITGSSEVTVGAPFVSALYINNGVGDFDLRSNQPFLGIYNPTVEIIDLDGDGDLDIFASGDGSDTAGNLYSIIYRNDGYGNFTKDISSQIPEISGGEVEFGDLDEDGDQDLIISGTKEVDDLSSNEPFTSIFLNNGFGHFTEEVICSFPLLTDASVSLGDVDTDGRLDILLSGKLGSGIVTRLYLNKKISNDLVVEICDSYEFDEVTLTETGNYQGVFMDEYGCTYPVNLDLTILDGDEVETTLDHCGAYEFGTQLLTESGIYTETFMNQIGCDSTVTLTFGYLPEPFADILVNGVVLFAETDAEDATFQWYDCDTNEPIVGEDKRQLTPPRTGNYYVEISNGICTSTAECVFFDWILATPQVLSEEARVYPNETEGNFTLDLNQTISDVNVRILSLDGRVVFTQAYETFTERQLEFKAEGGLYLVQVSAGDQIILNQRIIKR